MASKIVLSPSSFKLISALKKKYIFVLWKYKNIFNNLAVIFLLFIDWDVKVWKKIISKHLSTYFSFVTFKQELMGS